MDHVENTNHLRLIDFLTYTLTYLFTRLFPCVVGCTVPIQSHKQKHCHCQRRQRNRKRTKRDWVVPLYNKRFWYRFSCKKFLRHPLSLIFLTDKSHCLLPNVEWRHWMLDPLEPVQRIRENRKWEGICFTRNIIMGYVSRVPYLLYYVHSTFYTMVRIVFVYYLPLQVLLLFLLL